MSAFFCYFAEVISLITKNKLNYGKHNRNCESVWSEA